MHAAACALPAIPLMRCWKLQAGGIGPIEQKFGPLALWWQMVACELSATPFDASGD
ncbi:MAG: hypothetical protein H0V16_04435 [Burkholderiaceae bacterium]|nr:hypothetical protein [Burkholderiaceae bacterium]